MRVDFHSVGDERKREREGNMYVAEFVCVCGWVGVYIYIYLDLFEFFLKLSYFNEILVIGKRNTPHDVFM